MARIVIVTVHQPELRRNQFRDAPLSSGLDSGLVASDCALASAAAMVPIDSLERCMTALELEQIEADGAEFRALRAYPVADRFLGIVGHQAF